MIVAIDGPAASGKGTIGRRLAAELGLPHLDTGLLYRAVAKRVLDAGAALSDEAAAAAAALGLDPVHLGEDILKSPRIGEAASLVSAFPEVRAALITFQRDFAAAPGGAVLDGRDIGTVICPQADVKIFVTATAEERARRRAAEYAARGLPVETAEVLIDIRRRDERDRNRAAAPLRQAHDAHLLDTTHLDIDAAFWAALEIVKAVRGGEGRGRLRGSQDGRV